MPFRPARAKRAALRLILIRPSKYDDEGHVVRYWRGVLPSNTLAALASLARQAESQGDLGEGVSVELILLDEIAQRVEPKRLARRYGRGRARVAVGLVGVQTNQFPRAADLAKEFIDLGLPVLIGGFHVSGALAMSPQTPPELQELMDYGVTLVKGEVEQALGGILRDVYEGRRKPLYDIAERPDISQAPIPAVTGDYMRKFVFPNMGTIDAGRGCPFSCSFCTIINVQGRKMRNRSPRIIAEHIRAHYPKGIDYYFFTDDNFSRNPSWEAILDELIRMREAEGLQVTFMMQVDALAYRIKNFCEKARRAGCSQVFIGMETLRENNLEAVGKKQNLAADYNEMVEVWRGNGIAIHVGYIIGFPNDTPQTVAEDVLRLKKELKVDQASFFMLTPAPGSQDHADLVRAGAAMDPDYNKFDSFHAVTDHPKMTREEWSQAYLDAWQSFYTFDHLRERLLAASERTYWGLFKNYVWYKMAVLERTHPMISGFFRLKDRTIRRPGFAVQGRWQHARMRAREIARTLAQWARMYYDMQELWLQTRPRRGRFAVSVEELKAGLATLRERGAFHAHRLQEAGGERLSSFRATAQEGLARHWKDATDASASFRASAQKGLAHLQQNARAGLEQGRQNLSAFGQSLAQQRREAPERLWRFWDGLRFWSAKGIYSRAALNNYWRRTFAQIRRGRVFSINAFAFLWNLLRELKLSTCFTVHLIAARTK